MVTLSSIQVTFLKPWQHGPWVPLSWYSFRTKVHKEARSHESKGPLKIGFDIKQPTSWSQSLGYELAKNRATLTRTFSRTLYQLGAMTMWSIVPLGPSIRWPSLPPHLKPAARSLLPKVKCCEKFVGSLFPRDIVG